jgi:hypothetical protein
MLLVLYSILQINVFVKQIITLMSHLELVLYAYLLSILAHQLLVVKYVARKLPILLVLYQIVLILVYVINHFIMISIIIIVKLIAVRYYMLSR